MRGQLVLDLVDGVAVSREVDLKARRYWENTGPAVWEPVVVRVRYGPGGGDRSVVLPHVTTGRAAPRNVLVEREDGTTDVRPVRVLRVKRPC